jgi:drug/metabolite transporter (DMT)-like permease
MDPLQSNTKAAFWMGCSIICFVVMSVAGRTLTAELDVFQVMEMRSVIGFFMLLPLVYAAGGLDAMRTRRPLIHIGRNVAHYAGQFAWLLALGMIPLAELVSIEFTTPFWTAVLAVIFLGERMNARKVGAVALGFAGVAVIVRPGLSGIETGHLVMLAGAVGFGISAVTVKLMTRTESVVRIIFWMLIIQSVIGLIPAIRVWQNPPAELWPAILVISFTGAFAHYCLARALTHGEATVVMPMDFLRLPVMALVGWLVYSEQLDAYAAVGAVLILAGNLLTLRTTPGAKASLAGKQP